MRSPRRRATQRFHRLLHELTKHGNVQKAQQINHSLIALYKLVAKGRISPRRGSVLAYIGSLMLSSLKASDYDLERFPEEARATLP